MQRPLQSRPSRAKPAQNHRSQRTLRDSLKAALPLSLLGIFCLQWGASSCAPQKVGSLVPKGPDKPQLSLAPSPTAGIPAVPAPTPGQGVELTTKTDTWLKISKMDSREITNEADKCKLPAGTKLVVDKLEGDEAGHRRFEGVLSLKSSQGTPLSGCTLTAGYLWTLDFSGVPQDENVIPTPPVEPEAKPVAEWIWPTKGQKVRCDSSGAGYFGAPRYHGSHQGLDIVSPIGDELVATKAGTLNFADTLSAAYGYGIDIKHESGHMSRYAHLKGFIVRTRGVALKQGDKVGYSGVSGNAKGTTPHLHFEIRKNNEEKDPLDFLPNSINRKNPCAS